MTTTPDIVARGQGAAPVWTSLPALIAAVALAAAVFRFLPAPAAALLCLALGFLMALPGAADAAVRRGHDLRRYTDASLLRRLRQGGVWRVLWPSALGTGLAALLLVRLAAGGPWVWLTTLAAVPAALLPMAALQAIAAREMAGVHRGATQRHVAQLVASVVVLVLSILLGMGQGLSDPTAPTADSALIQQLFALHRLWAGVEAWLWSEAAALGLLPPWLAAGLAAAATGATGWAAAALTLAVRLPPDDRLRALATASDAPAPPAASRAALGAAALLAIAVVAGAHWAESRLGALPVPDRPVSRLQTAAEIIGDRAFVPGTYAEVVAARDRTRALDASGRARIAAQIDAGFDAMHGNVDTFLDAYYSLPAEYLRLVDLGLGWASGQGAERLQRRLDARLISALDADTHLAPVLDSVVLLGHQMAESDRQVAALIDARRLSGVNPGLLRIEGAHADFPPRPALPSDGLSTTLQTRLGASAATGAVAGWITHRIMRRLAARGALRLAARGLLATVPLAGAAAAIGADQALLMAEERRNRAGFRAEIEAALDAQRAELHGLLD
ncbi:hypothetical protein [Pararhodobacter sp. SW119]|uniref:hypothetical protein n=1 Tax=Pararhodobacter sp. SW119 TaxID=2780075 RepID=UPI001ADFF5D4|nr:hypothetical protein [Pararhodobacter sp. SW119]